MVSRHDLPNTVFCVVSVVSDICFTVSKVSRVVQGFVALLFLGDLLRVQSHLRSSFAVFLSLHFVLNGVMVFTMLLMPVVRFSEYRMWEFVRPLGVAWHHLLLTALVVDRLLFAFSERRWRFSVAMSASVGVLFAGVGVCWFLLMHDEQHVFETPFTRGLLALSGVLVALTWLKMHGCGCFSHNSKKPACAEQRLYLISTYLLAVTAAQHTYARFAEMNMDDFFTRFGDNIFSAFLDPGCAFLFLIYSLPARTVIRRAFGDTKETAKLCDSKESDLTLDKHCE